MNLMVNPTITGFRQEVDGTIKELKLGEAKEDAYANIIEQGGADLENNKAATINVSTYTEPVEITPTSGKDGMKKATITLSNIPQIQSNKAQTIDVSQYTEPVEIEPTSPNNVMAKATETLSNVPTLPTKFYLWALGNSDGTNGSMTMLFSFNTAPQDTAEFNNAFFVESGEKNAGFGKCSTFNYTVERESDTKFKLWYGGGLGYYEYNLVALGESEFVWIIKH